MASLISHTLQEEQEEEQGEEKEREEEKEEEEVEGEKAKEEEEDRVTGTSTFSPLVDTSHSQEVCDSDRKSSSSTVPTPEEV